MNKEKKIINNVSATTAIDLKAELAQHVEQFEKSRASLGKQSVAKRPDKKPTVWTRQNKGIHERNQRDQVKELEAVQGDVLQKSRQQLEKKARLYEAMRSGELNMDDEDDEKMPLIDFDRKYFQERELEKQKQEASESTQKKRKHDDDDNDPWVEFEDEFGRTRIIRRSELPSAQQQQDSDGSDYDSKDEEEEYRTYLHNQQRYKAADRSEMYHYEADRDIRTKGVGFYQFSKDEQERRAQMDKLNRLRVETENARNSQASASSKRKQLLAQNAEKIRARKAALKAKKHHQLKPEQQIPIITDQGAINVTEHTVTDFLKSIRKQVE